MDTLKALVATRFGTIFGTLNFGVFGTNFFRFGTAIVFFGTATRGGSKYWYYDVCFISHFCLFRHYFGLFRHRPQNSWTINSTRCRVIIYCEILPTLFFDALLSSAIHFSDLRLFISKVYCSLSCKDPLDRGNSLAHWQILRLVVMRRVLLGGLCEAEVDVVDLIELMLRFLVIRAG